MVSDELKYRIHTAFGHVPTQEQEHAIDVFTGFMADRHEEALMLLRGSAGTGKTTLAAAMVQALLTLQQKLVLLAPTGRAAKVFSLYAGHAAYTIHRRIYRQKSLEGGFDLNFNSASDTLFIVDEASMISTSPSTDSSLATSTSLHMLHSSLLDDLIRFVYNGRNCRLMLIGDHAQLPPVGEQESPALQTSVLRGYGLNVHECVLSEVLRQSQQSGILFNATRIRNLSLPVAGAPGVSLPKIRLEGFADIRVVPGSELIEQLSDSYSQAGLDDTLVITRSNKWANVYNQGIRNRILDSDAELCQGDRIMVVKNNYHFVTQQEQSASPMSFIANGDLAVVSRVRNVHEQFGFRFAEVTMTFPDYDGYEITATTLLDTLTSEAPALTREQQERLFQAVIDDYQDVPLKQDRLKKVKEDRYYNALQVKFAYAATCHKAQGGQWAHVYVDQGYMTDDMLTPDYLHWLYTAFTRATERLFLVNWPPTQTER